MFSFIRTLISVVIVVVAVACFVVWNYRVTATSYILSTVLNNPVTIGDVDISLSFSRINGKNVGIVNPPRSREVIEHAIKTRVFELQTSFFNWFKKTLVIERVYLDRVNFFVDMYNVLGTKNNVKTIIGNIHARVEERHPYGKKHKQPVIIHTILLQDILFSYRNPFLTTGIVELAPLNQIELSNLGTGHPVSTAQIVSIITTTLLKHFADLSGFKNLVENLPKLPATWFKNIFLKQGSAQAIPLETYLDLGPSSTEKVSGFFKKIFSPSRRPEESDDLE